MNEVQVVQNKDVEDVYDGELSPKPTLVGYYFLHMFTYFLPSPPTTQATATGQSQATTNGPAASEGEHPPAAQTETATAMWRMRTSSIVRRPRVLLELRDEVPCNEIDAMGCQVSRCVRIS